MSLWGLLIPTTALMDLTWVIRLQELRFSPFVIFCAKSSQPLHSWTKSMLWLLFNSLGLISEWNSWKWGCGQLFTVHVRGLTYVTGENRVRKSAILSLFRTRLYLGVFKTLSRIPNIYASASALGCWDNKCPNSTDVEDSNVEAMCSTEDNTWNPKCSTLTPISLLSAFVNIDYFMISTHP